MHALLDAALGARGDAEQLDAVAEIVGGLDVRGRDGLDAFDIDQSNAVRVPKASVVRSASLCAVSKPPMSKVGSASA